MSESSKSHCVQFIVEAENSRVVKCAAETGEFLNQVAHRAGITIQQTCGGVPSCTDCKVVVKEGINSGFETPLGPEIRLLGNVYFITHERLSCQAIVKNDSTVFVPTPRRKSEKSPGQKKKR
jgi:ferredoxin